MKIQEKDFTDIDGVILSENDDVIVLIQGDSTSLSHGKIIKISDLQIKILLNNGDNRIVYKKYVDKYIYKK